MIRARILFFLLLVVTSRLAASGWAPVTPQIRIGAAAYDQGALLASNGFDYLAAWTSTTLSGDSAVFTQRINADGTLVGDLPRAVDPPGDIFPATHTHPRGVSLTPGRDGYFVAWIADDGVHGAITDSFGAIERQNMVQQAFARNAFTLAAWNGAAYLVLSGFAGPFNATIFDNNGQVIQSGIPVGDTHGEYNLNEVIADGTGFLVLSTKGTPSGTDLYGRRMTSNGTMGDWFLIRSTASRLTGMRAMYDGSHDIIAWGDQFGIWMIQLDPSTNAAAQARQLLSASISGIARVLSTSGQLWIGYQEYQAGFFFRAVTVDGNGTVSQPMTIGDNDGLPIDLATNGTTVLSVRGVRSGSSSSGVDAIGRFVSPAGSDFLVSRSATLQQNGDLASDGTNTLVAWAEAVPPNNSIYAAFVGSNKEIAISSSDRNALPAVGSNGKSWLVAWIRVDSGQNSVVARRVGSDGALLDNADIVLDSNVQFVRPAISSDGSNWLVVWSRSISQTGCGGMAGSSQLFAARISADGVVLDPGGVPVGSGYRRATTPDVAWNGSTYLVTWGESCQGFHNPSYYWIEGGTISPDLKRVTSTNVTPDTPLASTRYANPRIAATADRTVIAWENSNEPGHSTYGYRVFGGTIPAHARQRAVGVAAGQPPLAGTLLGVLRDSDGQLEILTQATTPWAPQYQGVFRSTIDATGIAGEPVFRFVLEPDERLMGHAIAHGSEIWMPDSRFSPSAAVERMFVREFN